MQIHYFHGQKADVGQIIGQYSKQFGFDPLLISSIVAVESSGNIFATRFESKYMYLYKYKYFAKKTGITEETEVIGQRTSWGLMQIMGGVARELGFEESLPKLCLPEINLYFGLTKFSQCLQKYPKLDEALAAYNAGSVVYKADGTLKNAVYVEKVMMVYDDLSSKKK